VIGNVRLRLSVICEDSASKLSRGNKNQFRPAVTPPSTGKTTPVIQLEKASSAKNRIAAVVSLTCPLRPNGWKALKDASCSGVSKGSNRGVSTTAGAIALTRILSGANSIAKLRVRA
jgi:hypothetical protein